MQIYSATQKGPLKVSGYIDPDDNTVITVAWGSLVWQPNKVYRNGDICRPTIDNGYYYQCSTNGLTGSTEPEWDQIETESGTVIFTAVPWDLWLLPNETIIASNWNTSDPGVTLQSMVFSDAYTTATILPFSSTITDFEVTNQATKSSGESLSRSFLYRIHQQ